GPGPPRPVRDPCRGPASAQEPSNLASSRPPDQIDRGLTARIRSPSSGGQCPRRGAVQATYRRQCAPINHPRSRPSRRRADRLQAEGASLLAHAKDLAVVGLLEVLSHLRDLRAVFRRVVQEVDRRPPDAAVLVDYPDFNLRLARALRERGVPVVYYVSPQLW